MSFEAALIKRMLTDGALQAELDDRIDLMRRPGRTLPAITVQVVGSDCPQHMKGFQRVRATRVQIDVWAARPAHAIVIRDRVIQVVTPSATFENVRFQRARINAVRPGFDGDGTATDQQPQGELYREIIDITFTHNA